ncbi:MAG: hypothetical protein AAFZ65_18390 [Planctomycetota bacterium]
MSVLGAANIGHADNTQNTVYCLFEPDAEGLTADSFPTDEAVWFGTRPGRRRIFMNSINEVSQEASIQVVGDWYRNEAGHEGPPEVIERMVWEWRNVQDGHGLAQIMDRLAQRFPAKAGSDAEAPHLPVMPDLAQTINFAACDTRAAVVIVHPAEPVRKLEDTLARLAFTEGIAGRSHMARLSADEWAQAKELGQVTGGELEAGVVLIAPDPWGLNGEVWEEFPVDIAAADLETGLKAGLDRFRNTWRKQDRTTHMRTALKHGFSWTEYDPDVDDVVLIGEGSKKLGAHITEH